VFLLVPAHPDSRRQGAIKRLLCFWDYPGELVPEEISTFMVQGKITEADTLTVWLGSTPSGLISLHHPPIFTPDSLPAATLPLYPGL